MKSILLATVAAFVLPALIAPAAAQTANTAANTAANEAAVERDVNTIIVTATRRSEVLSDVPIAVTAVSAETLRKSGGTDIRSLNQLAPSLLVSSATNESNGAARIRGIGTVGENPGLESSVAVFIDGVYRSRTGVGLNDLGELDRIEVLRGPQGTLFGRNASAGLLNITTAQPKFELGGIAEGTYGNYNNIRFQGGITGPILGDKVAFRLDGVYNKRDGFLTDIISGRDLADRDRFLIRGKLLIKPTDDLSIMLIGDYNQKNEECCGAAFLEPTQNLSRNAAGTVVTSPNTIQALVQSLGGRYALGNNGKIYNRETALSAGRGYYQRTRDWGFSGEINYDFGNTTLTSITGYREFKNRSAQDSDFASLDILYRDDQNRKFQTFTQEVRVQGSLFDDRLDWLVGGFYADETLRTDDNIKYGRDYERFVNAQIGGQLATLASLVGYIPPAGQSLLNETGVVQGGFFRQKSRNYAFFTHNVFQIIPDKFFITGGLRYTNEKKTLSSLALTNNNLCGALRVAQASAVPGALAGARAGATALSCVINNNPINITPADPNFERKEDEFTGTVVVSFKPVDRLLTYASYSRGYKAGGFNLDTSALDAPCNLTTDLGNPLTGLPSCAVRRALPANTPGNARPEAADLQFEPEIVDAFEVGAKLDLREFKLNAALFYQKFKNFQLNTFNGVNFEVASIAGCADDLGGRDRDLINNNSQCNGKAKPGVTTKGVELEAFFYPFKALSFTTGITYADTRYANNLTGSKGASLSPVLFQLPGARLSNSSEYVVTASAAWTPQVSDNLSALLYADMRYASALNTGSDLDYEKIQAGYALVNARIGLYGPEKKWGIEFWAQNVFNNLYQQVAADAPLQGGGTFRAVQSLINPANGLAPTANQLYITFPAEPRMYGVTVRTRF